IWKVVATRRSCSRASSNGFSRRCETETSTAVTACSSSERSGGDSPRAGRVYVRSPDRQRYAPAARRAPADRHGDDLDGVPPRREGPPVGAAPGQPEHVAAWEHVAQARQQTEPPAAAQELDVEAREPTDLGCRRPAGRKDAAGLDRERGRDGVRGREDGTGETDGAEQVAARVRGPNRPRDTDRLGAAHGDRDGPLRGVRGRG